MAQRADFTKLTHASSYPLISPTNLDLAGRYVVITGAAFDNGVGYAAATAFAKGGASGIALLDLHGVSEPLLTDLKTAAKEAGRPEPLILGHQGDITDRKSVGRFKEQVLEAFGGRLDVLVNNAAHQESSGTILDADPDVYWRTWEVNVRGMFNMTRAFLPTLLDHGKQGGLCTVLNVASSGGLTPRPGGASYRSSKLAVMRWTENLQLDHQEQGLLTYCVNPGAIKTEITRETVPEHIRDMLPHHPSIAGDTIAWLTSQRRDWLAGRYVSCPWDMEELEGRREEIVNGDKLKVRMVT